MFFKKTRPVLEYNMRTHYYDVDSSKLYLYRFHGVKPNGYFIRQEVAHDLILRDMPMTAKVAVTGLMFVDSQGAGIVLTEEWKRDETTLRRDVGKELAREQAKPTGPESYGM